MVLPLIPVVLLVSGGTAGMAGLLNGARGGAKIREAKQRVAAAAKADEESVRVTNLAAEDLDEQLRAYGQEQRRAVDEVVGRLADFIVANGRKVHESADLLTAGASVNVVTSERVNVEAKRWILDLVQAAGVGVSVNAAVPTLIAATATASTGTAISTLSGAAAQSATLAWLGGGATAVGGGGMAVGTVVLNVVAIGPALFLAGISMNKSGETLLTNAAEAEKQVQTAVLKREEARTRMDGIGLRVDELVSILGGLVERGQLALDLLERQDFDPQAHAGLFQDALQLAIAVKEILGTQVVDEEGNVSPGLNRYMRQV